MKKSRTKFVFYQTSSDLKFTGRWIGFAGIFTLHFNSFKMALVIFLRIIVCNSFLFRGLLRQLILVHFFCVLMTFIGTYVFGVRKKIEVALANITPVKRIWRKEEK